MSISETVKKGISKAIFSALLLTVISGCSADETTSKTVEKSSKAITEIRNIEPKPVNLDAINSDKDYYAQFDPNTIYPIIYNLDYSRYTSLPDFKKQIIEIRDAERDLNYSKSTQKLKDLINLARQTYGANDPRVVELAVPYLIIQASLSEYKAIEEELKLLEPALAENEFPIQTQVLILISRSNATSGLGDIQKADDYIDEAIALMGERESPMDLALFGELYYNKGTIASLRGEAVKGADHIQTSLDYRIRVSGENNYSIPSNKLAIAGMLSQARDPRALDLARESLETATRILPDNNIELAKAMEVMGLELQRSGYTYEAAELFPKAIEIKAKSLGTDHLLVAFATNNLAYLQSGLGRHESSVELYLKAREGFLKNQGEDSFMAANAARSAASGMLRIGKADDALKYREDAQLIIDKKLPINHRDNYRTRIGLVDNYLVLERYEDAKFHAEKVVEGARQALPPEHEDYIIADVYLDATTYFSASSPEQKAELANVVYNSVDRLIAHAQTRYEIGISQFFQSLTRAAISQGLRVAIEQNDPDRAVKYLQLRNQSTLGGTISNILDREKAKHDDLKALVRDKQDALEQFKQAERAYYKGFSSRDNLAALKAAYDAAQQKVVGVSDQIKDMFPEYVATGQNQLFSISDIQSAIDEGETIVLLDGTNADLYVMAISNTTHAMTRVPFGTPQMEQYVEDISKTISPDIPFDIKASSALYKLIFSEPIEDIFSKSDDGHIKILVNGVLSNIPFSYLNSSEENKRYLIEDSALSILPSIGSLFTSKDSATSAVSAFLGVGDPQLTPSAPMQKIAQTEIKSGFGGGREVLYRGGKIDKNALSQFPELPQTRKELKEISRNFKTSKLLLGKNATEQNLKSMDLSKYSLIAFATHGVVADEILGQGEAGLILTPPTLNNEDIDLSDTDNGYLTASEILSFNLNADWIVLSACNTAAGQSRAASAYSGLTRSFIYAGADALLVSHWPVRDDAAAFLTVNTVNNAQTGMGKAQALRKAMIDLKQNSDIPNASHPAIWAPFVLVAD